MILEQVPFNLRSVAEDCARAQGAKAQQKGVELRFEYVGDVTNVTGDPLRLAAGHFGLGHGNGAHAPNEYYVVESTNAKVQGMDGVVRSFVEYLYELAG